MQKKIQKIGLLLGLGMFGHAPLFAHAEESEPLPLFINGVAVPSKALNKKLPNFLPKEDYWIETLRGEWRFSSRTESYPILDASEGMGLDAKLSFLPLGKADAPLTIQFDPTASDWERVYQAPFRLKIYADYLTGAKDSDPALEKHFVCHEDIKLWFENGEFATLQEVNNCNEKPKINFWRTGGMDHTNVYEVAKTGDKYKPEAEYKTAELFLKSVPVALTQGKKVILLQYKNTEGVEKIREFLAAPKQVERMHRYYNDFLIAYKERALKTR